MVAQSQSSDTYWLGSFAFNPYVQNNAVYTQWFQLSTQQLFSGAPTLVDDGEFAGAGADQPQNLFIIGPASGAASAFAAIQWNINTQTATVLPLASATFPSATTGNTNCSAITAFTDATIECGLLEGMASTASRRPVMSLRRISIRSPVRHSPATRVRRKRPGRRVRCSPMSAVATDRHRWRRQLRSGAADHRHQL